METMSDKFYYRIRTVVAMTAVLSCLLCFPARGQEEGTARRKVADAWELFRLPTQEKAGAILAYRKQVARTIGNSEDSREAAQENGAQALRRVAELYEGGVDAGLGRRVLKKTLSGVDLSSEAFLGCSMLEKTVEDYFALEALCKGAPAAEAWGRIRFKTSMETLGNEYDYYRYRRILEQENPGLALAYLGCLKQVFRYNGYTAGMEELRPLIRKYMPEGTLKEELEDLYESYAHLRTGMPAPDFRLKDFRGREHGLEEFKGKVLVVDVWATWCEGCVAKLPVFVRLAEKYKDRKDVSFATISIDGKSSFNRWKYTLPRLKMLGMVNLIAPKESSDFQSRYNITGVPRYFLIDRQGKIVNVYAPLPGPEMEDMLEKLLCD